MELTQEEIAALPVPERYRAENRDDENEYVYVWGFRWGDWPFTGIRRRRHEERQGPGGMYSRRSYRVLGMFWTQWLFVREGCSWPGSPWLVRAIQDVQRWLFYRSLFDNTVTVLGARFTWEFLVSWSRPGSLNWIVWALAWPLFLFLDLLRKLVMR